jgi:D-alanyl-D-alanine carboxypeptidase (penicillin-binding protein 5/6)
MKTGALRLAVVYFLLALAKVLAALESRVFDVAAKSAVLVLVGYALVVNRVVITAFYLQVQSDARALVWYASLPVDYFANLDQESAAAVARYHALRQPKPPTQTADIPFPSISAKSYVVLDRASNTVLSSYRADVPFPPASTAKIATALASFNLYKLDEVLTVPQFCTQVDGVKADLLQGQRFLVGDLLKALLVYSAGDAGCTLSIGKTSYADFIVLMNQVAKQNTLPNTTFTNPIGLDDADGTNLASAEDLARLGVTAVTNEFIREVVQLKEFTLRDVDGKYAKTLGNTNRLLTDIPESVGIKTGRTTGAGEVLIYEYAKAKTDVVIVVMGSSDRFRDTQAVLAWVLQSFTWE